MSNDTPRQRAAQTILQTDTYAAGADEDGWTWAFRRDWRDDRLLPRALARVELRRYASYAGAIRAIRRALQRTGEVTR